MKTRIQTIAAVMAGLAAVAVLLDLTEPKAIRAAVATLVTVANTPNVNVVNAPLPVSGTVAVSGGNVSVTDGTDAAGHPVLFTDGSAPRNSFFGDGSCSSFSSEGCTTALYTAPANDIAVIQSYSGRCQLTTSGDQLYDAGLMQPSSGAASYGALVPVVQVPGELGPYGVQSFNGITTFYLQPGETVNGVADAALENGGGSNGVCTFTVFGYLVPR